MIKSDRKFSYLLAFLFACSGIYAKQTTITGYVPSYKHNTISAYFFTHRLFNDPKLLASNEIKDEGLLKLQFDLKETQQIYIDLGYYHIYYVLSPGDSIEVELPLFRPLSKSEKYNVFFKPEAFYMVPLAGDSLNINASMARSEFMVDTLFNNGVEAMSTGSSEQLFADYLKVLKRRIESEKQPFVRSYMYYQAAPFYMLAYPYYPSAKIDSVFSNVEPDFSNPAFWEAFNGSFQNPFQNGGQTPDPTLLKLLFAHDFKTLNEALRSKYQIQTIKLADLLIIKGIYDSWHSSPKQRPKLIQAMNLLPSYLEEKQYHDLALSLKQNLTAVYPGSLAKQYELPNEKDKPVPLIAKNKVTLINFCSPEVQQCAKDFMALETIKDAFDRKLEVMNIVVYQDKESFNAFVKEQKSKTTYVHWNSHAQLLKDYQVKGLPSYYIVSPDGKFVASPAPGPDDGLMELLSKITSLY